MERDSQSRWQNGKNAFQKVRQMRTRVYQREHLYQQVLREVRCRRKEGKNQRTSAETSTKELGGFLDGKR